MNQKNNQGKKQTGDEESKQSKPIIGQKRNARQANIAKGDNPPKKLSRAERRSREKQMKADKKAAKDHFLELLFVKHKSDDDLPQSLILKSW